MAIDPKFMKRLTMTKTILIVGTYDTKDDELNYLADCIKKQGGSVLTMDVSVLGDPTSPTDHSKHDVAHAADSTIQIAIDSADENKAMQIMAAGASKLTRELYDKGECDGVIILGGTMGTDLALDVTAALPLGVPKYIVSTVSFSPIIAPERLAADVQMILWAGGLYGLNPVCKTSLSQAAGAVLGAANAVERVEMRPLIGMTSLGKTALKYMTYLKPELESRGFDVAVFHTTGMGGRAFESLAQQGAFCCVFDLCTQELSNHINGSPITAGADRLTNAGLNGIPQIVAPGCYDLVDVIDWQELDIKWKNHIYHAHNRLLGSVVLKNEEREAVALAHAKQLSSARGKTAFILPKGGCGEWDRPEGPLHDKEGLNAFCDTFTESCPDNVDLHETQAHINDAAFSELALHIFDKWVDAGIIKTT